MVGLHEAGREIDIQSFRYQSTGGDELETVLESIVDIECFLVLWGAWYCWLLNTGCL